MRLAQLSAEELPILAEPRVFGPTPEACQPELAAPGEHCSIPVNVSGSPGIKTVSLCMAKIKAECPRCSYFSYRPDNGACLVGYGDDPNCKMWTKDPLGSYSIYKACQATQVASIRDDAQVDFSSIGMNVTDSLTAGLTISDNPVMRVFGPAALPVAQRKPEEWPFGPRRPVKALHSAPLANKHQLSATAASPAENQQSLVPAAVLPANSSQEALPLANKTEEMVSQDRLAVSETASAATVAPREVNAPYGPPPRVDPRHSTAPPLKLDVFGPKQTVTYKTLHVAPDDPAAPHSPDAAGSVKGGPDNGHGGKKTDVAKHTSTTTATATTTTQALQEEPLPPWACFVIGMSISLVLVLIYTCIRDRCFSVVPRGADSERLAEVLQIAKEREQVLKEELEERKELARLADEALIAEGETNEAALAEARMRSRELQERADLRAKQIHEAAAQLSEQRDALIAAANRAADTFQEVLETSRESVEEFTKAETASLYEKMSEAAASNTSALPSWEPPDWLKTDDLIQIPPLMQLIAGMFAPMQLNSVRDFSNTVFYLSFIMLIVSAVIFAVDFNKKCSDVMVWVWQWGLLALTFIDFCCRFLIVRWSNQALSDLERSREALERANANKTGYGLLDMFASAKRGNNKFFEAYFKFTSINGSRIYFLMQLNGFLCLCWGGFGLYISIQDIIEDSLNCDARVALTYMHTYGFFFVLLISYNVLSVILWIVMSLAKSKLLSKPIIKIAKKVDDDINNGMPIALTLVESFVLKNSADAYGLSARQVKAEIEDLRENIEEAEEFLYKLRFKAERLEEMEGNIGTEAEFMERCQGKLQKGLEQAKPMVGLIAANVSNAGGSGADPTASGSASSSRRGSRRFADLASQSLIAGRFSTVGARRESGSGLPPLDEGDDVESF